MWIVNALYNILLVKLEQVNRAGREGRKQTLAGGGFGRIVHNKDECTATTMSFIPTEILASIFDFLDFQQLLACRAVRNTHSSHFFSNPVAGLFSLQTPSRHPAHSPVSDRACDSRPGRRLSPFSQHSSHTTAIPSTQLGCSTVDTGSAYKEVPRRSLGTVRKCPGPEHVRRAYTAF